MSSAQLVLLAAFAAAVAVYLIVAPGRHHTLVKVVDSGHPSSGLRGWLTPVEGAPSTVTRWCGQHCVATLNDSWRPPPKSSSPLLLRKPTTVATIPACCARNIPGAEQLPAEYEAWQSRQSAEVRDGIRAMNAQIDSQMTPAMQEDLRRQSAAAPEAKLREECASLSAFFRGEAAKVDPARGIPRMKIGSRSFAPQSARAAKNSGVKSAIELSTSPLTISGR